MNPVEFPEQTLIIAKDQPEYLSLPAHLAPGSQGRVTFCWSLSWKERIKLLFSGRLWHTVLTFDTSLQPQLLSAEKPDFSSISDHRA